jgi:uncharacterized protein (DUF305 family)
VNHPRGTADDFVGDVDLPEPAGEDDLHGTDSQGSGTGRRLLVAAVALLLLVATAVAAFQLGTSTSRPPESSADVGFARDMQTHHQQAVELAMIEYQRTTNASLRTMSYDIATSQAQQSGQMYGWLRTWGYTQSGLDELMTWMRGHPGHPSSTSATREQIWTAMGLATDQQVAAFRAASGTAGDRMFLDLMIAHHKGGVLMGQAALAEAGQPVVRQLATAIVNAQKSEILAMEQLRSTL